eukprot:jgi/Botrbrau1/6662/Bobra.0202s0010.1
MSFIFEACGRMIRENMEDPKDLDLFWNQWLAKAHASAELVKQQWQQPMKPYGFWKSKGATAKLDIIRDPAVRKLRARAIDEEQ